MKKGKSLDYSTDIIIKLEYEQRGWRAIPTRILPLTDCEKRETPVKGIVSDKQYIPRERTRRPPVFRERQTAWLQRLPIKHGIAENTDSKRSHVDRHSIVNSTAAVGDESKLAHTFALETSKKAHRRVIYKCPSLWGWQILRISPHLFQECFKRASGV